MAEATKRSWSNWIIRRATKDDIPILVRMRQNLQFHMETANERILKHSEVWKQRLPEYYGEILCKSDFLVLVASGEESGQVAGMAVGQLIEDRNMEVWRYVKIGDVWVDAGFRRHGICSLLLNEMMRAFQELGVNTFTLNYVVNNIEAESAWKALGFEPVIRGCVAERQ